MTENEQYNTPVVGGQTSNSWLNKKLLAAVFVVTFAAIGGFMLFRSFASTTSVTLFSSTTVPKTIDSGDGQAVEVGLKFQSTTAGTISGIRYYKSALNTGTHVGNLWSANGTLLATATFSNETSSGWQQVNFGNPIQIQANTTYVASYHTNSGHYSDDTSGLSAAINNASLRTPADGGATGPNGVYAYGPTSSFPTNGWQASNYYVDVVFAPAASNTGGGTSTGPGASAGAITVDQQVATHQSSPSNTITSPAFSTSKSNEVLEAFITSDGPSGSKSQSFRSVTGGGLNWTLKARSNTQAGVSEIWQAVTVAPLSNVQVTAQRSQGSYVGSIVVAAFAGANTTTSGATAVSSGKGVPSVSLTTTANNSWVWAVGNDYDNATARTIPAGQVKVDEYLAPVGDTYWLQRVAAATPTRGTKVTISNPMPTTDSYNLAAIELVPAGTTSGSPGSTGGTGGTVNTAPPSTPTNLTATSLSASQIRLAWAASTPASGTTITGYSIRRNGVQVATSQTATYTDSNLSPSTTYQYQVSANASNSTSSALSNSASATTQVSTDTAAPSVPASLKATAASATTVSLTWSASTDNVGVAKYLVLKNGNVIATSTTTSFSDTTAVANTKYGYQVEAQDAAGNTSAPSVAASVTTPNPADTTAPSVPLGLYATAASSTQANLAWTASTDNVAVAGYTVYRDGNKIGTTSTTSFGDATLSPSTTYSYTVSAYDGAGNASAKATSASVTTPSGATVACSGSANTPDGPDPWGGCFPGPKGTGVPANMTLTAYTGPCVITTANTVIDKKTVDCNLDIQAKNVVITNSKINGYVMVDNNRCDTASFSISDSTIHVGDINFRGLIYCSYKANRVDVSGGQSMAWCDNCTIQDSYLHNPLEDPSGAAANRAAHNSTVRMSKYAVLNHNTFWCFVKEYPQPNGQDTSGCSANQTGYSHDGSPPYNSTVEANLYMPTSGGYCAYGGSTTGETNMVHDIVFKNNVFRRDAYAGQGGPHCGYWGSITSFDASRPGNQWVNNKWDDGTTLTP